MEPIWTSYETFLTHPDESIRAWALRRLHLSSPEQALTAARALLTGPSSALTRQAALLLSQGATAADADLLRTRLQAPLDDLERAWLLEALGSASAYHEHYSDEISKTLLLRGAFWEGWAAVDAAGCTRALLELWAKKPYKDEEQAWILAEHSQPADAPRLLKELKGLEDKDSFAVALLHSAGAEDLFADGPSEALDHAHSCLLLLSEEMGMPSVTSQEQRAFAAIKKKNWENAIKLALAEAPTGEPLPQWSSLWAWSKALRAALLAQPRGGSTEARLAFALCVGMRRALFLSEHLTALTLKQLVELRSMIPTAFLEELDHKIVEEWSRASEEERAHATEDLREQVSEELNSNGALPALLQQLPGVPCAELLLSLSVHDFDTMDEISPYFAAHPEALRALTIEHLGKGDGEVDFSLLCLLQESCDKWPTALLLERRDQLDAARSEAYYHCLSERADPDTLAFLRGEWRPDEVEVAEALMRLAALTETTLPPEILADVEAHEKKNQEADAEDALRPLLLECLSCHRVYRYRVHRAAVAEPEAGWEGVTIFEQVVCKNCGAQDQYQPTLESYEYLTSLAQEDEERPDGERRVVFGNLALSDGSIVKTWSEGFLRLKEIVQQEPEGLEGWLRLANYLRTGRKPSEAALAYQKCLLLDPGCYEALFSMTTCYLLLQQKIEEGLPMLREAVKGFAGSALNGDEEAAEHLCSMLYSVAEQHEGPIGLKVTMQRIIEDARGNVTKQPGERDLGVLPLKGFTDWEKLEAIFNAAVLARLELTHEAPSQESEISKMLRTLTPNEPAKAALKVGRNEPCPCGSGQKYKKCHGR